MHLVEEHYYTINKFLLMYLGIWPHHKPTPLILLQRTILISFTVTYISLQLSIFITTEYTMPLFVKTVSRACPCTIIVIKYCAFIHKSEAIKNLHWLIQEDWKIIRDKLESKIIQRYAHNGQSHARIVFSITSLISVLVVIIQLLPDILDAVLPLGEPRPRGLLVPIEYFFLESNDDYYYIVVLHQFAFIGICALMVLGTGTQLLTLAYHSFGMFKIASHRIEYTIEDSIVNARNFEKEHAICKTIMHAVIAHRRAMQYSNIFLSTFNIPYCIIAILGIISLSINLYGIIEAATISKNMENLVIYSFNVIMHLVYMFIASYVGQKIIDCNNDLFRLVYNTSWYLMPVSSQKLILFVLQKTGKEFYFIIGLIFIAKLESLATLINTAMSYVAVMYSCTQK